MSPTVSFMVSRLPLLQQDIQAPVRIERLQFIGSTNMTVTDENLRYGIAAAARAHLLARSGYQFDIDLLDGNPLVREQAPCSLTIRAPVGDVHEDFRATHRARAPFRRATAAGCPRARRK